MEATEKAGGSWKAAHTPPLPCEAPTPAHPQAHRHTSTTPLCTTPPLPSPAQRLQVLLHSLQLPGDGVVVVQACTGRVASGGKVPQLGHDNEGQYSTVQHSTAQGCCSSSAVQCSSTLRHPPMHGTLPTPPLLRRRLLLTFLQAQLQGARRHEETLANEVVLACA